MRMRQISGVNALEYEAADPVLTTPADVVNLIGEAFGTDARIMVVPTSRLGEDFFSLRSGFAGEVFQKFQNYQMRLVVMGDIGQHLTDSKALRDFVGETNRIGNHLFVSNEAELATRLEGAGA